jgi:hypothetical protein
MARANTPRMHDALFFANRYVGFAEREDCPVLPFLPPDIAFGKIKYLTFPDISHMASY